MVSLLLTVSCTGHNSVMYEHLSNRDNYGTYQARVVDMYVYDQESKTYYRDYQSEMFLKGKVVFDGPKVAPRTSPLAQICRIWEFVNNISLENGYKERRELSLEEKQKVVNFLDNNEKMTATDFSKLLGLGKKNEWDLKRYFGKNGIKGNETKVSLKKVLKDQMVLTLDLMKMQL